jgi:hypothetical protein
MNDEFKQRRLQFREQNPTLVHELMARGIDPPEDFALGNLKGTEHEKALVEAVVATLRQSTLDEEVVTLLLLLAGTTCPYDGATIVEIFHSTEDASIRYDVMIALSQSHALGVGEWIENALRCQYGVSLASMLAGLMHKRRDGREYLPILREHYSIYPFAAARTFRHIGG